MTLKKHCLFAALATFGIAAAAEEKVADNFELTGNIQTQAAKAFYDNDQDNTLDGFWFRANIGGSYSSDNFDAKVTFACMPRILTAVPTSIKQIHITEITSGTISV